MSTETNAAQAVELPARPQNYFSDANARADHFRATVAALEKSQPAPVAAAAPVTAAPAAEPDAKALETLSATAQYKLADGRPALLHHSGFRAAIEKMRADVFAGKPWDATAAKAELHRVLGLEPPAAPDAAPKAGDHAPPQGTPEDRAEAAADDLAARLTKGEFVPLSDFADFPDAFAGYKINLPPDWGVSTADLDMLATARAAGIAQETVDAFVAARLKGCGQ